MRHSAEEQDIVNEPSGSGQLNNTPADSITPLYGSFSPVAEDGVDIVPPSPSQVCGKIACLLSPLRPPSELYCVSPLLFIARRSRWLFASFFRPWFRQRCIERYRRVPAGGTTTGVPTDTSPLRRGYASFLRLFFKGSGWLLGIVHFALLLRRWRPLARHRHIPADNATAALAPSAELGIVGI